MPGASRYPRVFAFGVLLAVLAPHAAAAPGEGAVRYEVSWKEVSTDFTYEGWLGKGLDRDLKFDVKQDNVTEIRFTVKWTETDDQLGVSGMDRFRLDVARPDGEKLPGAPAESNDGFVRVTARNVNALPGGQTVVAQSPDDAKRALDALRTTKGKGVWQAKVALVDTGERANTADVDRGNAFLVVVTLQHYVPQLMKVVSLQSDPSGPSGLMVATGVDRAPSSWLWTFGLLAAAALGMGGYLAFDTFRSRAPRRDP